MVLPRLRDCMMFAAVPPPPPVRLAFPKMSPYTITVEWAQDQRAASLLSPYYLEIHVIPSIYALVLALLLWGSFLIAAVTCVSEMVAGARQNPRHEALARC